MGTAPGRDLGWVHDPEEQVPNFFERVMLV
jgi:hypothetical protein